MKYLKNIFIMGTFWTISTYSSSSQSFQSMQLINSDIGKMRRQYYEGCAYFKKEQSFRFDQFFADMESFIKQIPSEVDIARTDYPILIQYYRVKVKQLSK